jgi:predicted aconitase with swiveling domain
MAMTSFLVRSEVLVPGIAKGVVVATHTPLSLWGGLNPDTGEIIDRFHPLSGQNVANTILLLPCGRGSCSASGVLLEASRNGVAPAGFIVQEVDPILGLGAVLSEELLNKTIPVVKMKHDDWMLLLQGDEASIDVVGLVVVSRNVSE